MSVISYRVNVPDVIPKVLRDQINGGQLQKRRSGKATLTLTKQYQLF